MIYFSIVYLVIYLYKVRDYNMDKNLISSMAVNFDTENDISILRKYL